MSAHRDTAAFVKSLGEFNVLGLEAMADIIAYFGRQAARNRRRKAQRLRRLTGRRG